jgi:hypothetical protein
VAEIEWLRRSGAGDGAGDSDAPQHRPARGHPAYRALLELAGYATGCWSTCSPEPAPGA